MTDRLWTWFFSRETWLVWRKRAIIIAALGLSLLLALVASIRIFQLVLVALAAGAGLLILLRWPNLGLIGVMGAGFAISFSGPGGLNAAVLGVAGLVGLWVVDLIVFKRDIFLADRETTSALLLFMASAVISFGVGQLPWYPLAQHAPLDTQAGGLAIFLLSAAAFLLVGNTVRDLRWLQAFTWAFLMLGVLYAVGRFVPQVGNLLRPFYHHGVTANSIFWIWLLLIPFSQAWLNTRMHMAWRVILGVFTVVVLYMAVIQARDWKSGYIPPLAGAAVIVALRLKAKTIWFLPIALVAGWFMMSQAIATDEYSYFSRLDAWKIVIQLSWVSPVFGLGFANYYWYTHLIPIMGWHVAFNSHSQYVDLFSQVGLVGLFCFFFVFWKIGKLAWRLRDNVPEGFARAYVYGALGAVVATLVAGGFVDWVLPFTYNIGLAGFRGSVLGWMFLGGLVAIQEIVKNQKHSETELSAKGRTA